MSEEQTKNETAALEHPTAGIEGLLSNPELLRTLGTLIGTVSKAKSTENTSSAEAVAASAAPPPAVPSADGLSAVLSNPELMEKLPGIIATLSPLFGGASSPQSTEAVKADVRPVHDDRAGCRDQLLLSLKPFLSKTRCDAIDTMLRIAALSHVLGQLN